MKPWLLDSDTLMVPVRAPRRRNLWQKSKFNTKATFMFVCFVCLFVLFVCLFVCLFCLFVCLFVFLFVFCLFVCLFACLFACLFVCLFVCLFACLFVCLLVCLFVCLFFCFFVLFGFVLFSLVLFCLVFCFVFFLFCFVLFCFVCFVCRRRPEVWGKNNAIYSFVSISFWSSKFGPLEVCPDFNKPLMLHLFTPLVSSCKLLFIIGNTRVWLFSRCARFPKPCRNLRIFLVSWYFVTWHFWGWRFHWLYLH